MDFLVATVDGEWAGVQRKEVRDLVASVRGDRIAREIGQAEGLAAAILVIEGDWRWDASGRSGRCRGWTRAQLDGLLLSFQVEHGWKVMHSTSLADTAALLHRIEAWFAKATHGSLSRRPKPRASEARWGEQGHRATGIHILQSVDGMGPTRAAAVFDHFGSVPLRWSCTQEEMLAVPGIGPGRVKKMWEAISGPTV